MRYSLESTLIAPHYSLVLCVFVCACMHVRVSYGECTGMCKVRAFVYL